MLRKHVSSKTIEGGEAFSEISMKAFSAPCGRVIKMNK